jgi:glycosyltransferase involved in cell wall biosynthesis
MRVALVTDGISPFSMGGMQRHSRMLLEHLCRLGVDVTVFHTVFSAARRDAARALEGVPADLRSRFRHEYVDYPSIPSFPGHYLVREWEYSRRCLHRFLEGGHRADFVYAQGLTGWAFLRHSERRRDLPRIGVNTHGYEMFQRAATPKAALQHAMLRPAFRQVNLRADVVFCFSGKIRQLARDVVGVPEARMIEVPNGVDGSWISTSCRPTTGGVRRFIFIGRMDRRKGLPELLQAVAGLPARGWALDIVGPVPADQQIHHPCVRFLGPISDSAELQSEIDRADCLVCPSHSEGMPTVILEAMARGLAVIATDVGATAEVVDASNGELLDAPHVPAIAGAMRRMIERPSLELDAMKAASLARSSRYAWDQVASRILEGIRDACRDSVR